MAATNLNERSPRFKDETGNVYGKLTVIEFVPGGKRTRWRCRCACGNFSVVEGANLRIGASKSCSQRCGTTRHGQRKRGQQHLEYPCWQSMKDRCCNPLATSYKHYGGRGITVCERWINSFEIFLTDMGPRPSPMHTLDRYPDKNGNYEPANCRWATKAQQANNTRRNRFLTFRGETRTVTQWAITLGFQPDVLRSRIRRNWTVEKALTTPQAHCPPAT